MRVCVLISLLGVAGCVGKKKYDLLLADYNEATAAIEDLELEVEDLNARYARERERSEALTAEKASLLQDQSALQSSVAEMQKALLELSKRKTEADARIAEFRNLLARFKSLIDAGKLRVKIVDGRMVVELATDILFDSGSAKLSDDGQAALAEVALVLASIPDRRFQVEGHTDDVPIKTAQYPSNWELAAGRAVTVVKALVQGGLPAERVSAASYGEFKPAYYNDSPEGRAANRRIEIVVVPDLSQLPGFEELTRIQAP
jgi:chemotaxis protein MotB